MALPMFGGMAAERVTLFVVPVVYCADKAFNLQIGKADPHWAGAEAAPHGGSVTRH